MSSSPPSALDQQLRAGFARAAPLADQYQLELVEAAPSRPVAGGTPWAGSARADAVLALARANYAEVGRADWRDGASLEDWAVAYRFSHVMRGHDPLAARVHARVEEEVRRRFGVDVRAAFLRESTVAQRNPVVRRVPEPAAVSSPTNASDGPRATTPRGRPSGVRTEDRVVIPGPDVSSEEMRLAWSAAQVAALGFAQPAPEAVRHSRCQRALQLDRGQVATPWPEAG